MPDIVYAERFTVKYPRERIMTRITVASVATAVFALLWLCIEGATRYLFTIFTVLSAILLLLFLFCLSFECSVTDSMIRYAYCGFLFKKEILWDSVRCVRIVERNHEKDVSIILYDRCGQETVDFHSEMENAWFIVKAAEHRGIEIRKERDLSLKELRRL